MFQPPFEINQESGRRERLRYNEQHLSFTLKGRYCNPLLQCFYDVFYDTIPFRRKDNQDSAFLSHYRKKKKLRVQNFRGNQQMPKMSDQKRQILISNAFRKLYSTESLSQDQAVEIRLDNSNFDNPPPPTT